MHCAGFFLLVVIENKRGIVVTSQITFHTHTLCSHTRERKEARKRKYGRRINVREKVLFCFVMTKYSRNNEHFFFSGQAKTIGRFRPLSKSIPFCQDPYPRISVILLLPKELRQDPPRLLLQPCLEPCPPAPVERRGIGGESPLHPVGHHVHSAGVGQQAEVVLVVFVQQHLLNHGLH